MGYLTKECIKSLNSVAFRSLIPGLEGSGMTLHGKCPKCGAEGKVKSKWAGLWVKDDEVRGVHMIGCNSCGWKTGKGSINMIMEYCGLEFLEACREIAKRTGAQLSYEEEADVRKHAARQLPEKTNQTYDENSFVSRQLRASGLTYDDVRATVTDGKEEMRLSPFRKGALDPYTGRIDPLADEMLILYYDLEGRRRTCIPAKNKSREVEYTRVRWSNPDAHKDRYGKAVKYQTIAGAKTELYIPEHIRRLYKEKSTFETLFIQEGEKKAEKACKHGIPSIAIQGIGNLGRKEDGLPSEVQYLVQRCKIRNIVMLMDSDWDELSRQLREEDRVDSRPKNFALSLIKFKKYIATLGLCGIDVDIWFAHVNKNEAGDKGVDDLLCNTLRGREDELRQDLGKAMITHDGKGEFIDIINITSWSDTKIMSLWSLNNKEDFFARHEERLLSLHTFKFGDVFYKVADSKIETDSEYGAGKEFWSVSYDDKGKRKIEMDFIYLKAFLDKNGFRSRKTEDGKREFVKIDSGVIRRRDEFDIRSYVLDYVNKSTRDHAIQLFFAENIVSRLSVANLCQLELLQTTAGRPEPGRQRFFFCDSEVSVRANGIESDRLTGPVWEDNLLPRKFERQRIFRTFEPDGAGSFRIEYTEAGKECEFLTYLRHTSTFWGRTEDLNSAQLSEHCRHMANKITCIGYLLRDMKYMNETKVVVAMDAQMSEVAKSNGRTGKSFIGKALAQFVSQAEIDGRNLSNDDQYMFSEVTPTTRNIFIDDINPQFDFGKFYQRVTGKLNVNIKQGARFYIPFEDSPKFYFTTNHALSNLDDSAMARLVFMSFSDWYTSGYSPFEEFGHLLFTDWDDRQWCLFDNLMAECVMIYMRSRDFGWEAPGQGAVSPPMADLRLRELRQEMGELFLGWAEIYFAPDSGHLGSRIKRKDLYEAYLAEYGIKSTQVSSRAFRDRIYAYCEYAGLHFNTHRRNKDGFGFQDFNFANPDKTFFGERDVSNGEEYYTISGTENFFTHGQQEKLL